MKKLITIIALSTLGVLLRAKNCKKNNFSLTITNSDDELLVDLNQNDIIFHKDVKIYINSQLVN